ncbi:MAG: hypothetical protein KAT30_10505, partial [Candidatus Krumholzibacteria bacterium]|nr:hypothetical protein [Candidatus Krumholzibacteria bacterium]
LRIRKNGDSCKITKKEPTGDDLSILKESTTPLTKEEYDELTASIKGKRFRKIRYFYKEDGVTFEIDVYKDALEGFVVVDAEFPEGIGMNDLKMPAWCLADVSQEEFVAGGYVAGRSYKDIEKELARYNYRKL